jgi:4-hydroxy-tetrahydrodipicolinate synthase
VLEYLVESKIHGVIIGGSTGEYYAHTTQERVELAAQAKDVLNGRLPLIVGTGGIRTEDAVAFASHAKEIKADALLVGTPPYALPTQQEIALHVKAVDAAAGLPIMLYNYPGRMSVSMGEEFFDAVADVKNIVAIKESSGDMAQLHRLAIQRPNIQLSCGWDDQALEFFAWGAKSWVCAGSNFIPREHVALYEACVIEKNFDKGRKIMAAMMPLMDFLEGGKFVQAIKNGVALNGLKTGGVRKPLYDLDAAEKQSWRGWSPSSSAPSPRSPEVPEMADLLSKDQYAAIAADLQLRTKAFIDGEFRDAISGRTFVTTNPATGKQLAEVAACDVNDVDVAVAAAKRVFEAGTWSKMQPNDRKHVLQKFAQLLEDNAHELAVLEALDSGKPVSECQTSTCRRPSTPSAGTPS